MHSDVPRSAAPPSLRRAAAPRPPALPPDPLKPPRPALDRRPIAVLAATASLGAAAIHAAVVPEHDDWAPSASFFGALAAYQLTWAAILLLRPVRPGYLWAGAGVNAVAVAVWLQSRIAGVPFGPHRGEPEPFARTDVLAGVLQITVVAAALAMMLRPRTARMAPTARTPRPRLAIGTATASVAAISAFALSGAAGHAHTPGEERPIGTHDTHSHVTPSGLPGVGPTPPPSPAARKVPAALKKSIGGNSPTARRSTPPPAPLAPAAPHGGDGHVH